MYDPRGDTHVRSLPALEEKCRLAGAEGGEFYMIVGMRQLSEVMFPDLMQRLRDPGHFERMTTLWGVEPLNTLEIYRWRGPQSAQAGAARAVSSPRAARSVAITAP